MAQQTGIHIAGRWEAGTSVIENRNPSDLTDLIGAYGQASGAQLDEALAAARKAQPVWWAAGVQKRHMAGDDPRLLQPLDPAPGGGGGHARGLGKVLGRDAGVALKLPQKPAVRLIQGDMGHGVSLFWTF